MGDYFFLRSLMSLEYVLLIIYNIRDFTIFFLNLAQKRRKFTKTLLRGCLLYDAIFETIFFLKSNEGRRQE